MLINFLKFAYYQKQILENPSLTQEIDCRKKVFQEI